MASALHVFTHSAAAYKHWCQALSVVRDLVRLRVMPGLACSVSLRGKRQRPGRQLELLVYVTYGAANNVVLTAQVFGASGVAVSTT